MSFNITTMFNPDVYDHPVDKIELVETHISWVLLTGKFAYKIKKPVNYGFLDFSTLEKRHDYCEQELRLNRRLAAAIYLDVVSISGSVDRPRISVSGEAFEYAVKMLQFPQSAQLDHMLEAGELNPDHIDAVARMVASFHQTINIADDSMEYGNNLAVYNPVEENFIQIKLYMDTAPYLSTLTSLKRWAIYEFTKLEAVFSQRKRDGFVRECHGDMHLRNLVWLKQGDSAGPVAFDCIEFNPELRWIDVISEVAFVMMDLQDRQEHGMANRFLNSYLEVTGDYSGLSVLHFYLCYRALVRAKVDALRLAQKSITEQEKEHLTAEFESYLDLAMYNTQAPAPKLIIMHGLSASGKSTVSHSLADALAAVRIRSDVERKRMFNTKASESALYEVNTGIYSWRASQQAYAKLAELAEQVIAAGYSVIVDAAFLKYEQRQVFHRLARQLGVAYIILDITAPIEMLRERIVKREHDVSDAGLAVLQHQLVNWNPLLESEIKYAVRVNTAEPLEITELIERIHGADQGLVTS